MPERLADVNGGRVARAAGARVGKKRGALSATGRCASAGASDRRAMLCYEGGLSIAVDLDPIFLAVLFVVWAGLGATAWLAIAIVRQLAVRSPWTTYGPESYFELWVSRQC